MREKSKKQLPLMHLTPDHPQARELETISRITCGSFEGLRADHDSDGNPVLMGVRNGGKETVPVDGMSDGTVDQLYLALRLAGLDHYLEANEPMPFVVDDILIKFDNERAAAALQALGSCPRRPW